MPRAKMLILRRVPGWGALAGVCGILAGPVTVAVGEPAPGERPAPRVSPVPARGPVERTTSASGQFVIHGGDHDGRAHLAMRADEVREDFVRLVDRADPLDLTVAVPGEAGEARVINIWIRPGSDARPAATVTQIEGSSEVSFSLVVDGAEAGRRAAFSEAVLRLLIGERILRGHSDASVLGRNGLPPAWLFIGLSEAIEHNRRSARSARFAATVRAGRLLEAGDIFAAKPEELDAVSREVFAVSACGLVLMLFDQPQGPMRFRKFLARLPVESGDYQTRLVRHFPGLALSKHSLEKWWSIQLAALAQPGLLEALSPGETERRLEEALLVRLPAAEESKHPGPLRRILTGLLSRRKSQPTNPTVAGAETSPEVGESVPITEFQRIAAAKDRDSLLQPNQTALAELNLRAFPLHRPVIEEYQRILGLLIKGRTKELAERIQATKAERERLIRSVGAVEDHLDWFEATRRTERSGTFEEFFRRVDRERPRRLRIDDPMSRHLDDLEREYE